MTQVSPVFGPPTATVPPSAPPPNDSQFGQDAFLKLLVAQLKYQDPLSPTEGSEFLTQTAQFTALETLQKIQSQQEALARSTEMLSAASMVGREVTFSLAQAGLPATPAATSLVAVRGSLPKDAPTGARVTATTDVYTSNGTKIPLTLQFTRAAEGWTVQSLHGAQSIGAPSAITFDPSGDRNSAGVTIPASALDAITGTAGTWPAGGVTLDLGEPGDPTRLQLSSGPATVAVVEQNGNDGNTATGIVTGIRMTVDGPQLVIGGRTIPLASISDVQS